MSVIPVDVFTSLLVSSCDILRKLSTTPDDAGVVDQTLTTIATGVPCRLSTKSPGRPKELKADAKFAFDYHVIFMLPYTGTGAPLTKHDWILLNGQMFDILHIADPSEVGHHYELWVEEINP